jgi:transcriptional regulator with PAS, ATPase and Fis domain
MELTVSSEKRRFEGKIEGLHDSEGQIFAYAEILKDVTDQMRLEQQEQELSRMKREMQRIELQSEMIGISHAMRNIFDLILRCAKVESTVLVLGETGTGKEMVARAIHNQSDRKSEPFIAINCGALPESLLESELFGYVKGAFTGAVSGHKGLFREADGGTLFFDEIGDLSPTLQVKLLRVLQEREIRPVGGSITYTVNVRVIAATHRNIDEMIKSNQYRRDLYYRLAVIPITIAPLRHRKEDILPLAEHFIKKHLKKSNRKIKTIDHSSQRIFLNYNWPGKIRELENCIEHALAMSRKKTIAPSDLPVQVVHPQEQDMRAGDVLFNQDTTTNNGIDARGYSTQTNGYHRQGLKPWEIEEKLKIEEALLQNKGNRTRAAKDLGISRGILWRKIGLFQIDL